MNGKHNRFKYVVAITVWFAKLFENLKILIEKEKQETHEYSGNSCIYLNRAKEAQEHSSYSPLFFLHKIDGVYKMMTRWDVLSCPARINIFTEENRTCNCIHSNDSWAHFAQIDNNSKLIDTVKCISTYAS